MTEQLTIQSQHNKDKLIVDITDTFCFIHVFEFGYMINSAPIQVSKEDAVILANALIKFAGV